MKQEILDSKNLLIKHRPTQNSYEVHIKFDLILNRLNQLYKSNIFLSTYKESSHIDGFIPINDSLHIRLSIIHKLGAIVKINADSKNPNLVKLKVSSKNRRLVITVFPEQFEKSSFYEDKFHIKSPILNDFYVDISLAKNEKIIQEKWNEKSTPNKKVIKKDHIESEQKRYKWSENSDGGRRKNEYFSGDGSNIGRGAFRVKLNK